MSVSAKVWRSNHHEVTWHEFRDPNQSADRDRVGGAKMLPPASYGLPLSQTSVSQPITPTTLDRRINDNAFPIFGTLTHKCVVPLIICR
jgi:hypothetical protein